jgi:hypothetical protein
MSKYRLFINMDIPVDTKDNWDLIMNFKDLWNKYTSNEMDINNFTIKYKYRINEYKNDIINIKGVEIWNSLVNILNSLTEYNESNCYSKFDEIYNWADKNNIKIEV